MNENYQTTSEVVVKRNYKDNLYSEKLITLPTPNFVVFYNGVDEQPERKLLKLSDSYEVKGQIKLDLEVLALNINVGYNEKLMKSCKTLSDYAQYVNKVRTYVKDLPIKEAVEKAVKECIADDILAEYLRNHRAEVMSVSICEYDEDKHMRQVYAEGQQKGEDIGSVKGEKIGLVKGEKQGRETEIFESVLENDYSAERGAEKLNISKEEFETKFQSWMKENQKINL